MLNRLFNQTIKIKEGTRWADARIVSIHIDTSSGELWCKMVKHGKDVAEEGYYHYPDFVNQTKDIICY